MQTTTHEKRYQELDALRGIAALMVVFFHFTIGRPQAGIGFYLGKTGVDLFFLISGFVIFMSVLRSKTTKEFIINRISRLYPTYWAGVSFAFIIVIIIALYQKDVIPYNQYLGNMTMFQHYFKITNLDGPYWTLIIEMNFYFIIAVLFYLKKTQYLNHLGLFLSVLALFLISFLKLDFEHNILYYLPILPYTPLFFSGIIFYKIYINKTNSNLGNYLILLFHLPIQIILYSYTSRSLSDTTLFEYAVMVTVFYVLLTLFINGKLKFIVSKASLFLGKISYALYLTHQKLSIGFIIPILTNRLGVNFWIAVAVTLPIVIALATFITFYIEIPYSKKMKQFLLKN